MVVVSLGVNDRQELRVGEERYPVRSEEWVAAYEQRIDAMTDTLNVYGRPFFWVSAPPLRGEDATSDIAFFNGLIEPRVTKAGGYFIDVWNGFTNASGQYITTGPGHRRPGEGAAHQRRHQLHQRRQAEARLLCRARHPPPHRHRRGHGGTGRLLDPGEHDRDRPRRQEAAGRPGDLALRPAARRQPRACRGTAAGGVRPDQRPGGAGAGDAGAGAGERIGNRAVPAGGEGRIR